MESGVNGKVAVRCYGHLHLAADLEQDLAKKFQVHDWHRPEEEYSLPVTRRQPFRAIVKELIRKDTPLSEKLIRKMLRDLIKMRALGVYPLDVYERNYKGGLLLDMSVAVTEPHFELVFRGPIHTRALQRKDLMRFQRIIDDSGVRTWQRSLRNRQYCMKLRNCPNGHEKRPKWHVMSITPIDPKWRGLDGSDVDTHVQISRKPKPPKSRRR